LFFGQWFNPGNIIKIRYNTNATINGGICFVNNWWSVGASRVRKIP
jgi:hypothetical protein